jgi:hypothetical protein
MRIFPMVLIAFWIIIILFPALLAILIGGFFIFIWLNILIFFKSMKWGKSDKEEYVKFGKYKIYR